MGRRAGPDSIARLHTNLALNPALAPRIDIIAASMGATHMDQRRVSIDGLIARGELTRPDFVKIDVEGSESTVIQGMRETLTYSTCSVVVETHSADQERECVRLLIAARYQVTIVRNAWWRALYPEYRPIVHNRWLLAEPVR